MEADFHPSVDPEEIKHFLHGLGLIPIDEYYSNCLGWILQIQHLFAVQLRQVLRRQERSSKTTSENIQKRLAENGMHKDDLCKNLSLLCARKRTSFSPVITRKRGKAIKKRTPSASQLPTITTTTTADDPSAKQKLANEPEIIDDDQPLDLRVRAKSSSQT